METKKVTISTIGDKRWLTLREARFYSGIGIKRLKLLAQEGKLKGCPDPDNGRGDWIFDRASIDAYREGQMIAPTIQEKALAIMRGVRL
jgi:hypothetical protein